MLSQILLMKILTAMLELYLMNSVLKIFDKSAKISPASLGQPEVRRTNVTVTLCDTNIVKQIHRKSRGWDDSHQNKEELLKAIKSAVIKTVNIEKNISGEESCQNQL